MMRSTITILLLSLGCTSGAPPSLHTGGGAWDEEALKPEEAPMAMRSGSQVQVEAQQNGAADEEAPKTKNPT